MKLRPVAVSLLLVAVACGDDSSPGGGATGGANPQGGNGTGGVATGAGDTGGAAAGGAAAGGAGTGGAPCVDTSMLAYSLKGECLTFESASTFCGFSSDEAVCNFAVSCGTSSDLGQCQINCEQGSSSFCHKVADVDCVVAALCADDCAALAACNFIL